MTLNDVAEFAFDKTNIYISTLIIVNTIDCAIKLYQRLKIDDNKGVELFHLSNNMCPQNKLDILNKIKKALKDNKKKVICVSTQVVEAGVNFSFGCVIRSKAGLDNVIQAAGRCNRHKEFGKLGAVYIIQISKEIEKLTYLAEIRYAQAALQNVLDYYRLDPNQFGGRLDSEESIKKYYENYYHEQLRSGETKFPIEEYGTTLVDLFGINNIGRQQYQRNYGEQTKSRLAQAFYTAGQKFEVISNNYKMNVIVPYNDEAKELISKIADGFIDLKEYQMILRKLQRYSVGISEQMKDKLNNAICAYCDGKILVLGQGYYSNEIGVIEEPIMEYLSM